MPVRVVHLTSVHHPFDNRIYHKECRSLALAGYDVTLIATHAGGDQYEDGVRLKSIPPPANRRERMTSTIWQVWQEAVRQDAAIYHFHDPELMPVGALLKLQGKQVIYDVHEDYSGSMKGKWIPDALTGPAAFAVSFSEATLARACDRIVAATPTIARKFPAERTRLVQNFPWLNELRQLDPLPYDQREAIAIYIGWLSDARGIGTMIEATKLAAVRHPVKLLLAGKVIPGAKAIFEEDGPNELVEYLGFLDRPRLAELIARARVGLVTLPPTGNYINAQPTKLFEYMAGGLPVIASNFPVYRSFVESSRCGLLVDPLSSTAIADALVWLLENPDEAGAMGRRGQQAVNEKYNWEHEAETLVQTYAELLSA
jgi:glycosyltransferase involved in cell wall biosynthesis